jgi:hypothetical protein
MAILPTGIGPVTGYNIERSLRFNKVDSAYLNRTLTTPTNNLIWTWSAWIKRSDNDNPYLFTTTAVDGAGGYIYFASGTLVYYDDRQGSNQAVLQTSAVYRDQSAWYHFMVVTDRTQATASNRAKIYVNGSQVTAFNTAAYPNQNEASQFNSAIPHYITPAGVYFNGYMAEVNFIDGQALTPSSFGETDINTGVWKPKAYSGTYGTNGFFLKFADNSGTTSTTLGKDSSGNGNNWTPNNFSVTAGIGNDSLVDSPTPYGTDTGVGGTVRGNYCTFNPLASPSQINITNGNLLVSRTGGGASGSGSTSSTMGFSSGKWYWEIYVNSVGGSAGGVAVGIVPPNFPINDWIGSSSASTGYWGNGALYGHTTGSSSPLSYTDGDTIGVALDMDNKSITFYKNNTNATGTITGLPGTTYLPAVNIFDNVSASFIGNFGQRAFTYTAPSGFKALCTQNLPTPAVVQGDDYFNTVLYTGNGSNRSITGVGFQPDFVWLKKRSGAESHALSDVLRGTNRILISDSTAGDNTATGTLTAFNSDGFSLGTQGIVNDNTFTFTSWNWKAGGTGVSNTAGSISSTVSASTTAGFSVVTYTGTGSNATVGHGLGAVPRMIIIKGRDTAYNWRVYHASLGNTGGVFLNTTAAFTSTSGYWNDTTPTSTVFTIGTDAGMNQSAATYVAYCFAPVAGYSDFGFYRGNAAGPFVYLGFRPAFLMIKRTDSTGAWVIIDSKRNTYNPENLELYPNTSGAEANGGTTYIEDFVSNGFKIRQTDATWNATDATYIYAAFAENPFKYSLAR